MAIFLIKVAIGAHDDRADLTATYYVEAETAATACAALMIEHGFAADDLKVFETLPPGDAAAVRNTGVWIRRVAAT